MKKIFSVVIACGLAVTLLAGCGSKAPAETPAPTPEVEAPAETPETPEAGGEDVADGGNVVSVESDFDERGWKQVLDVTFDGDTIVDAKTDYVNKDGGLKSEDAEYNTNMEEKSGISAADALKALAEDLVAKQDPNAVDVVTGATSTSEGFIELAKQAVEQNK